MLYYYYRYRSRPRRIELPDERLPAVTVQLPIYNERFVVERLLKSVGNLDYPREKLEIQVLDDSTDETRELARLGTRRLAEAGINAVYIHRDDRTGFKAGALENGLRMATGEFIAIFDADFVPKPDFLRRVMPCFSHERVGMVQMRWDHLNRDCSFLTQCQAIMLDGHFVIENAARHFAGCFFNFNGTAGVWRKAAIQDGGGWQHDTLTEDLDLSYRAQLRGWDFVYLADDSAPAELPVEINAFKSQQHRWTKGSIQTALKLLPSIWRSSFPARVKVEATFHLANNFSYLLLFLVSVMMLPVLRVREIHRISLPYWIDMIMFWSSIVSIAAFYIASQRESLPGWKRQLRYIPFMMSLAIGLCVSNARAVLEALFGVRSAFVRTPKFGVERRGESWWSNPYISKATGIALVESALALYYAWIVAYCIAQRNYYTVPFMLLFLFGFAYVGFLSLASSFRRPFRAAAVGAHSPIPKAVP